MARPFNHQRPVPWKLRIPADLAAAVEEMNFNHLTNRPRYGSKSKLVTELLRRYVDEQTNALAELETKS